MTRSASLAGRAREVLLNGRWIANTNFKEQLESVTWEQATRRIGTLNTIAALTYHINYYLAGVLNVLQGGRLEIHDALSFDRPPIASARDWSRSVAEFVDNAEKIVSEMENMDERKWDAVFDDPKYGTFQRNLEGLIEHSYYHLGQLVLVKKLLRTEGR